jgi:hypothetical protein
MAVCIRRWQFIGALGGAAVARPFTARAQQPTMPVIGWLSGISPGIAGPMLAAFWKSIGEAGFIENRNVRIEHRWAEGRYDRLPAMAADLVVQGVAVITTQGGEVSALAAKAATSTIPIVMIAGGDPVQLGLMAYTVNQLTATKVQKVTSHPSVGFDHKTKLIHNWFAKRSHYHMHFTPTSSSWINQVERFFALLTDQQLRRGAHRSAVEL